MVECGGSSRSRSANERFWLGVDGMVGLNSLSKDLELLVIGFDVSFLDSGPDVAADAGVDGGAFLLDGVRKKAATWGLLLFGGDNPSTYSSHPESM